MEATEHTFQQEVIERSGAEPVVVDFWADWCGPCHALAPVLEAEAASRGVTLVKVDVDANPALGQRYGVRGIPAVKGFRNGEVVAEFSGAQPRPAVAAFLDGLTGPSAAERLRAELEESGEFPEILGPLAEADYERALEWLLGEIPDAGEERRARIRDVMVVLFGELGQDHPVSSAYRRRLATALY
jgi:thioredoxin